METSFKDRSTIAAGQYKKEKEYWLQKLAGDLTFSTFPYDHIDHDGKKDFQTLDFEIGDENFSRILQIAQHSDFRLHMILTTVVLILLEKYTGNRDIVIGVPIYKQDHDGEFINTVLTLRGDLSGDPSFKKALFQTRENLREAVENANYPIRALLYHLNLPFEGGVFSLFDVTVLLENIHNVEYLEPLPNNIRFNFNRYETGIEGEIKYNSLLYHSATIENISRHFLLLLRQALFTPDQTLSQLEILTENEKRKILCEYNGKKAEFPIDKTLHELFEKQVLQTPDEVALVYGDKSLTYSQLNQKANQLAHYLRMQGLKPDHVVGLMMDRSLEMVIGMIGILKAGGAFLPIDLDFHEKRIHYMMQEAGAKIVLTKNDIIQSRSFTDLQGLRLLEPKTFKSKGREPAVFDKLPLPDRSLVDYEKYHQQIGQAFVRNCISIQATRGCPHKCIYCSQVWPDKHNARSAENIFKEIRLYYEMGVRRFSFVEDIFNLDVRNGSRLFEMIIKSDMQLHLLFGGGLRGDILSKDFVDLMVAAGTINIAVALETAVPRLQKLLRKNLQIDKLRDILEYIITKHPYVITEMFLMHGFPTETKEDAAATMKFLMDLKWIDFPYINILKIYPETQMETLALQNGISKESISLSQGLAWHDLPYTLPFERSYSQEYQADFLNNYFLNPKRLRVVLPRQMKVMTEFEMIRKYDSYLSVDIKQFDDILKLGGLGRQDLGDVDFVPESRVFVPNLNEKIRKCFPVKANKKAPLKTLFLDFSQYFGNENKIVYDVVEAPLGLIYLASYCGEKFGDAFQAKIAKSQIDFDDYQTLRRILEDFKPDIIAVRTLTFYKEFFHKSIALIRQWGYDVPIIAGGPYASHDYLNMLKDKNIDIAVLGEGEITFGELVECIMKNKGRLPDSTLLREIPGICFIADQNEKRDRTGVEIVLTDVLESDIGRQPTENPLPVNQSKDLAYIMFTSGSTGNPKGIMVEHRNVINTVCSFGKRYGLKTGVHVAHLTDYTFDPCIDQIFAPLIFGARVITAPNEMIMDRDLFREFIDRHDIHLVNFVPTMLKELLIDQKRLKSLRYVVSGGERLNDSIKDALIEKGYILYNQYGPTETTIDALVAKCADQRVDLGKPIENTNCYIFNEDRQLAPIGVAGELCIGGAGVARGYVNRNALTEQSFIPHPFAEGERLYRTGDQAKWLPDGSISFIGRKDFQVKIRGNRVELEEIERQISRHSNIMNAAVITKKDRDGVEELYAFYVSKNNLSAAELKEYLSKELPLYMVPSYYAALDKLPLTPNKKIDRKALEMLEVKSGSDDRIEPPRNEIEKKMVEIWSEILGIKPEEIGINSNFFELGGHSLRAVMLVTAIRKNLNAKVSLSKIFEYHCIKDLAPMIQQSKQAEYSNIPNVPERDYYDLSHAQMRLWIICQFEKESSVYNMPESIEINGPLNVPALEKAIQSMVARHESLRTVFITVDETPKQKILKDMNIKLARIDLSELDPDSRVKRAEEIFQSDAKKEVNLETGPLCSFTLVKLADEKFNLNIKIHHIITDGWSQGVFFDEMRKLYHAYSQGLENPLSPLRLQYKDYADWHNQLSNKNHFASFESYWLHKLRDKPRGIEMPVDYPRKPIQTFNGGVIHYTLDATHAQRIKRLCRENDVTLFMAYLGFISILLHKYSDQNDMLIGSPVAGRNNPDLKNLIGFLVNTIVLRNEINPDDTIIGFLKKVRAETIASYENQDYPFDVMVERLNLDRDLSQSPLFNIMLAHNNTDFSDDVPERDDVIKVKSNAYNYNMSVFDLVFFINEDGAEIAGSIMYNADLYKKSTVERMASNLLCLIDQILDSREKPIKELDYIHAAEYKRVMKTFNETEAILPEVVVQELFERQVEKTADKPAVDWNGMKIHYEPLNKRANQLAHYLRNMHGVKPNTIVALSIERSIDMIVAVLGIMKSGATYLAVDPTYPRERIAHMINDSRVQIIVSDEKTKKLFENFSGHILNVNALEKEIRSMPDHNPKIINRPDDILYINYTSGSTGVPNGAMLSHHMLGNLILWQKEKTSIDSSLRCLQFTSLNFCVSFQEIMCTLTSGGEIYLIGEIERQDIDYLIDFLGQRRIELLYLPFSYLNFIFNRPDDSEIRFKHDLKHIITAGDQLKITTGLKKFLDQNPEIALHNHYGSSEMHVVTSYTLHASEAERMPIPPAGKPIANHKIFILDNFDRPVPIGVWGELCCLGRSEVPGYIYNEKLSRLKLKKHDFAMAPEKSLYHSGDVGRWLEDGNIELHGRKDLQVKIRGFRVELGEIESRLFAIPQIQECVTAVRLDPSGQKYIVAYIVAENISNEEIRKILIRDLPQYMIPGKFIRLPKLPLMPNGKVDKENLPDPNAENISAQENERGKMHEILLPADETESALAEIWSEILGVKKEILGTNLTFFELGGHSLSATILISKIFKRFHVRIPLGEMFKMPTIQELAQYIRNQDYDHSISIDEDLVLLKKAAKQGRCLFLIHDGTGDVDGYVELCNQIKTDLDIWGIKMKREMILWPQKIVIENLSQKYLQKIKHILPRGPYFLGGWSVGGTIGYEISRQIMKEGGITDMLFMIDTPDPHVAFNSEQTDFTHASELRWITRYLPDYEPKSPVADLQHLWLDVVDYLKSDGFGIKAILKMLPKEMDQAIPDHAQIEIEGLIYYLNIIRSFISAHMCYTPREKINAPICYFAAEDSKKIIKIAWGQYTDHTLTSHTIQGDHFSIVRSPGINQIARHCDRVLYESFLKKKE